MGIDKGAYLPFGENLGDHRNTLIEIPSQLINGKDTPKIFSLKSRRLT